MNKRPRSEFKLSLSRAHTRSNQATPDRVCSLTAYAILVRELVNTLAPTPRPAPPPGPPAGASAAITASSLPPAPAPAVDAPIPSAAGATAAGSTPAAAANQNRKQAAGPRQIWPWCGPDRDRGAAAAVVTSHVT